MTAEAQQREAGTAAATTGAIREQALRALHRNRTPGFHFPGHFLGVHWQAIGPERARLVVPDGPHLHDATGAIDFAVLAVVADIALGTAARLRDVHHERQATVHLQIQLTGAKAHNGLEVEAAWRGSTEGTRSQYCLTEATLQSGGRAVAHACGSFVRLGAPPGVALAPLPWQRERAPEIQGFAEEDLEPPERQVLETCDLALRRAGTFAPFIRQFWCGDGRRTTTGATRSLATGAHVGNRVGHVQGGILLALAAACAADAVSPEMLLSNASAWFLRPGVGRELTAISTPVHIGTTTAVVQTQVTAADGTRVIEAMTQHVLGRAGT